MSLTLVWTLDVKGTAQLIGVPAGPCPVSPKNTFAVPVAARFFPANYGVPSRYAERMAIHLLSRKIPSLVYHWYVLVNKKSFFLEWIEI